MIGACTDTGAADRTGWPCRCCIPDGLAAADPPRPPSVALLAELGSLVGDPARTNMLLSLRRGGEMTAGQLADAAGVAPQTASGHLGKLATAGLVKVDRRGRYHHYRLGSAHVASLLDAIHFAASHLTLCGPDRAPRPVRYCRDHMSGSLAAAVSDAIFEPDGTGGRRLRSRGRETLAKWGLTLLEGMQTWEGCAAGPPGAVHIGGSLGAAMLERALSLGWVRQEVGSRDLQLTIAGRKGFQHRFAIDLARHHTGAAGCAERTAGRMTPDVIPEPGIHGAPYLAPPGSSRGEMR